MVVSVKIRNPWSSEKYWDDCIELARTGESSWWHQVIEGDINISTSIKSFTDSHFPLFSFAYALAKFNTENERELIFDPEDLDSEAYACRSILGKKDWNQLTWVLGELRKVDSSIYPEEKKRLKHFEEVLASRKGPIATNLIVYGVLLLISLIGLFFVLKLKKAKA